MVENANNAMLAQTIEVVRMIKAVRHREVPRVSRNDPRFPSHLTRLMPDMHWVPSNLMTDAAVHCYRSGSSG